MTFEEQLAETGRLIYTNKGISMLPLLREDRDVMVIEAVLHPGSGDASDASGAPGKVEPGAPGSGAAEQTKAGVPVSELQPLDAVLFVRPGVEGRGHYVLHRILRVNPDGTYFIIGDNLMTGETVAAANIIGRLTAVIQGERNVSMSDPLYRMQVKIWWKVFPLRRLVRRCKSFVRRCGSFVKHRVLKL